MNTKTKWLENPDIGNAKIVGTYDFDAYNTGEHKKLKNKKNEVTTKVSRIIHEEFIKHLVPVSIEKEDLPTLDKEYFKTKDIERSEVKVDCHGIKYRTNKKWDVQEIVEGEYAWQQFFTDNRKGKKWKSIEWSAKREIWKSGKKLVDSSKIYYYILSVKYNWNYENFIKWEHIKFPGIFCAATDEFMWMGNEYAIRCADGSIFSWNRERPNDLSNTKLYGYSVLCVDEKSGWK